MELRRHRSGAVLVIDAYNANPASMRSSLTSFLRSYPDRDRIAVLGDMLELGNHSKKYHLQLGRLAGSYCDLLIGVGKLARYFKEGMGTENTHCFSSKREAVHFLKDLIKPGDIVLVKGSRLMQMEEVADALLAFIST